MSLLPGDTAFGPGLPGRFDFTLTFEQIIFTLLPCSLFIVVIALQIHHRRNRPAVVKHGLLFWAKMVGSYFISPLFKLTLYRSQDSALWQWTALSLVSGLN